MRINLLRLQATSGLEACTLETLAIVGGSSTAFGLLNAPDLPLSLSSGESYTLLVAYEPAGFGRHITRLSAAVTDPHATPTEVTIVAECTASNVVAVSSVLRADGQAVGQVARHRACIENHGTEVVVATRVRVGVSVAATLRLPRPPDGSTALPPGGRMCVEMEIERLDASVFGGEVLFELGDGGLPIVIVVLGLNET